MRLGDCIHPIDVRNRDMISDKPMGINIDKYFMPSVANVVGTDLSNYKVVEKNQFACNLMHVGRDERLPIAILEQEAPIIVSPAYYVFEINPGIPLMPSFLMLWFKRPEFDRNAWFYTDADVRGGLDRDSFLDMEIPVPNIDEQRRIVAEYQAIKKRIAANEALIAKLEETSSELFLNKIAGYLSSDPIPADWQKSNLPGIAQFLNGVACQKYEPEEGETSLPVIKIREIGIGDTDTNSDLASLDVPKKYIINKGDLLFSWSASLIVTTWCGKKGVLNQHIFKVIPSNYPTWFCYHWIKYYLNEWNNFISAKATSMGHLKLEDLDNAAVVVPSKQSMQSFDSMMSPMFEYATELKREVLLLNNMKDILLARLSKA